MTLVQLDAADCAHPSSEDTTLKYVTYTGVALLLAVENVVLFLEHRLLAPTLLRSQLLSRLYRLVRGGNMTKEDTEKHLSYV